MTKRVYIKNLDKLLELESNATDRRQLSPHDERCRSNYKNAPAWLNTKCDCGLEKYGVYIHMALPC